MKRVLVTGASGRIGRRVVPLLLERGYAVRCLVHRTPLPAAWAAEVESVGAGEEQAVTGVQAVVHLAGVMPPASDEDVFQVNVDGTRRLLRAVAENGKPCFIFASSDATYCTGWSLTGYSAPIAEDAAQHPTVFYGLSKVMGERLALYYEETAGLPVVRLRFVWTLDPPEILDLFTKAPYKDFVAPEERARWEGNVVAIPLEQDGSPFTEHVCDARDAASAVVLALESRDATGQAFNIAGPASFRYTEVGPQVASRLGAEPVALRCAGIHSYSLSIDKARRLLGYSPKYRVEDSLDEAIHLCPKPSLQTN
ncbi:MAG TPA: NAD(P)-dependent oxidoreductase [Bryobacteraceae bacterium]|nr:NAD(P)-dependent oxidoreductase [Bryobacteraceae bacterium]